MSNTEEVKIQAESLLKILEETKRDGIVKRFYDASNRWNELDVVGLIILQK